MAKKPETYDGPVTELLPPLANSKPQRARGTIVVDPEMKAMNAIKRALAMNSIQRALASLPDDAARQRVLTWLQSRWAFHIVDQNQPM